MLTRRKIFGWAATVTTFMAIGAAPSKAAANPIDAEFSRLQKWFREHPELLWAPQSQTKLYEVRERAQRLAQPFMDANQRENAIFELDAWIDHVTDSVLLKGYMRTGMNMPVGRRGPEIAVGCALTRRAVYDSASDDLDALIKEGWHNICLTMLGKSVDPEWQVSRGVEKMIRTYPELRSHD